MNVPFLDNATPEQIDLAAEANMVTHMSWVQRHTAGMRVIQDDELTVVDSGLASDTFSYICRARLYEDSLPRRIAQAIGHFNTVQRPFSWWVGPADRPDDLGQSLIEAGLEPAESEVAMVADLATLNATDLTPHGLRIERATTPKHIRNFGNTLAALMTPSEETVIRFYEAAAPLLSASDAPMWLYVGYLEPVATAELTASGGVAGLYNISTLELHRHKGIGSALTLRPLLDARTEGFKMGILQAAADGLGVYTRLGFRATGQFTEYQLPAPFD
ncbi:MAG: GNAT family N-acetyltransferase [Planctomycetes bacterium]|nr:GNAT family N-acetyltransferase [Planctomycetota bacterium]